MVPSDADDGSGRRFRIVVDPHEELSEPPLTRSLERSLPWDAEDREVARTGDAGF